MTSNAAIAAGEGHMAKSGWQLPAFVTLCVVTLVAWAPFLSVLVSGLFAAAFGCTLNEAKPHPCVVAGIDFGGILANMFVLGWLMLVTAPLMMLTVVAWIALGIVYVMRRLRTRRSHV